VRQHGLHFLESSPELLVTHRKYGRGRLDPKGASLQ